MGMRGPYRRSSEIDAAVAAWRCRSCGGDSSSVADHHNLRIGVRVDCDGCFRARYSRAGAEKRLWAKVNKAGEGGCWLWTGAHVPLGYGHMSIDGKQMRTHRISWMFAHGSVPEDAFVCHRCDVPACVNPDHLFLGTQKDNMSDCSRKGRARGATGEASPFAKLTADAVRSIRSRVGHVTMAALAREYGVNFNSIRAVVLRRTWKHVA